MATIFETKGKIVVLSDFILGTSQLNMQPFTAILGIHMQENLDFCETAEVLSQAGGRALGAMISKIHSYKDIGYNTYSKLFNSCVAPVIDYCSGVWGFKQFNKIDTVQNRAIRYFLGVHRFTPLLVINGEMGWTMSIHRRLANMFRLWNRLTSMNNTRLTKHVFNTDYNTSRKTWCSEIKSIFEQLNMQHKFVNKQAVDLKRVENFLGTIYQRDWNEKLTSKVFKIKLS